MNFFKSLFINLKDINGETQLIKAVRINNNNIEIIKILELGANTNIQTNSGSTALIEASDRGHTEYVRSLLQAGANPNLQTDYGYTALIYASLWGNTECVRLLLGAGVNTKLQNIWGYTAYVSASLMYTRNHNSKNHKKIIKILKIMPIVQILINF